MHLSQFHDSVHTSIAGQQRKTLFFLRIGYGQTQRLHVSVKLRNRIRQIVDL